MTEQCSKAKFLGSNGLKDIELFSSSQFKTTITLTPCVNNVTTTILNQFINHSFNFIQSKKQALFLGSMPDAEESELDSNNSYSSNEDSEYIYYPCSPIHRFKENKFEVSDFSLR